jgi:hypothetical protein
MKDFLTDNWLGIVMILVIMGFVLLLALRGKKGIATLLYILVTEAERLYGSKTGSLKFDYVFERIRAALPAIIRPFFSKKCLTTMIETALTRAKERWIREGGLSEYIKSDDSKDVDSADPDTDNPT